MAHVFNGFEPAFKWKATLIKHLRIASNGRLTLNTKAPLFFVLWQRRVMVVIQGDGRCLSLLHAQEAYECQVSYRNPLLTIRLLNIYCSAQSAPWMLLTRQACKTDVTFRSDNTHTGTCVPNKPFSYSEQGSERPQFLSPIFDLLFTLYSSGMITALQTQMASLPVHPRETTRWTGVGIAVRQTGLAYLQSSCSLQASW